MRSVEAGKYAVFLVDDHPLIRRGIRKIIEGSPELEVVGEAGDGQEFLDFLNHRPTPNLAIMDLSMPRMGGIEATYKAKASHPQIKILILTMYETGEYVELALAAGAEGYLLKEEVGSELLAAIATLRRGGKFISQTIWPR